jgi:DNA-binding CsgD family transcriptional regulator
MKLSERKILDMHRRGMSYGEIAAIANCSRQNIHRLIKYKKRSILEIRFLKYILTIKKK